MRTDRAWATGTQSIAERRIAVAERQNRFDADSSSPGNDPFVSWDASFHRIGNGKIGGKAEGLCAIREVLEHHFDADSCPGIRVGIPNLSIITTEMFDRFMEKNQLYDLALSETHDHHLASAFQKAELPGELIEELREFVSRFRGPIAVRSSSLLEDAMHEPFAGVYATKMIPNNQFSVASRMRTLMEAVKFVYASTFFKNAKNYLKAAHRSHEEEKMAVILQEMVGCRHGNRFYPTLSGVARSYNFYSLGYAKPEQGVVHLALGMGKTIVDGGKSWSYCPAFPKVVPPYGSTRELMTQTQTEFWAVNMSKPPAYAPHQETEYLCRGNLIDADTDGTLTHLASTYNPQSDRITMGTGPKGPRILNFSPLLQMNESPINDFLCRLLETCEDYFDNPVEIEFAMDPGQTPDEPFRFGFLQVRPMILSRDDVDIDDREFDSPNVLVASEQVLGNGALESIQDVVYVKPDVFSAKHSGLVAAELDQMNRKLLEAGTPYLLIVIGRLGTSDPWLGIPVEWGQVAGARAIVEASVDALNVDMSQGSHFFHNMTSFRVLYFSTDKTGKYPLDWAWLDNREMIEDKQFTRHVKLDRPLDVKVDGKNRRGVISHERSDPIGD